MYGNKYDTKYFLYFNITIVEEEGALWDVGSAAYKDKNEVARAWKKVNQVQKICAIKSQSVNRFGAEKSRDLNTILPHSLGAIFPREKSHNVNRHLENDMD